MDKIKYGTIEAPDSEFLDENMTAHISIRLPLKMVKDLKRISLTPQYEGRYQLVIKDVLQRYVDMVNKSQDAKKTKTIARESERKAKKRRAPAASTRRAAAKVAGEQV